MLLLCTVLVLAILYAVFGRSPPPAAHSALIREYELYKSELRPDATLQFEALSTLADEAGLKTLLSGLNVDCRADWTGIPDATRSCAVDLKSLNGVPTMYVNFTFASNRLLRVSTAIPQEAHAQGRTYLEQRFGKPEAVQRFPSAGVRLVGWTLSDGSTLFYNRDRFGEDYAPSSIQWLPKNACDGRPCIAN
ncbi:hypothetical protein ASD88_08495 [Pelomonas sp. Root662]|nr:hypothetical protein ASC81_08495 [Pelomonas sp. Root405]KRA73483.1 hypothetical protein ASD88_08495 [Pelomonas sp. Root662]